MIYPFDLQLFAEGGAGDGGAGAGTGAGASGVNSQDAAANTGVTGAAAGHQGNQQQPAQQDSAAGWQEAKSRYKSQYDADVNQIVRSRLKDAEGHQRTLETLQPMLNAMATQMGVQAGDYQAMVDRYMDRDELYEKEAMERGSNVETIKEIHQLRNRLSVAEGKANQYEERQVFDRHMQGLMQQAEALKTKYPQFDLNMMVNDERFWHMAGPNGPLNLEQAYVALHPEVDMEIIVPQEENIQRLLERL